MSARIALCGVDPGSTTGIFTISMWSGDTVTQMSRAQLPPEDVEGWLAQWFDAEPTTILFIERYFITQRTTKMSRQPAALEVTGVVKNLCHHLGIAVKVQAKSDASKLAHDSVLREIGWYTRGMRHANDAAKHVLLGMSRTHPLEFQRIISRGIVIS